MRKLKHSPIYLDIAAKLDAGFSGNYRQLGQPFGMHPRGVGSIVRKYAKLNPTWDHNRVVAKGTTHPAYVQP